MSIFNPESFIDATLTAPSTRRPLLPTDREYTAIVIGDPKARTWQGKQDATKSGVAIDLQLEIEVPADLQPTIGQPKIQLRDSIMLDTVAGPDGQVIIDNSPGRNGRLRQYRESVNLNKPGDAFNVRMLQGRPLKVKLNHKPLPSGDVVEEVGGLIKAS